MVDQSIKFNTNKQYVKWKKKEICLYFQQFSHGIQQIPFGGAIIIFKE